MIPLCNELSWTDIDDQIHESAHVGFVRVLSDDLDGSIKIVGHPMFTAHGVFKTVNIEVRIPKNGQE